MQIIDTSEMARLLRVSRRHVQALCQARRIIGAYRLGRGWFLSLQPGKRPQVEPRKMGRPGRVDLA